MSSAAAYTFGPIPTLSTVFWSVDKFINSWKWRDRSMEAVLQRFVELNQKSLSFLGIHAAVVSADGKLGVRLTTSRFVGAVPVVSPSDGRPAGDLYVTGRFGEDASELMAMLDDSFRPDYAPDLSLNLASQMQPPIFLECCKYVELYREAEKYRWRKFTNEVKQERVPSGATLWADYALRTARSPQDFDRFCNKKNVLTTDHDEWAMLTYVLQLAISQLESPRAPLSTRYAYADVIAHLKLRLRDRRALPTVSIATRNSDPEIIKRLKAVANNILGSTTSERIAWRMDYAEFFERYVQYLFREAARTKGARTVCNPHYRTSSSNPPSWALSYLEPDLVVQKDDEQCIVDAKYKSHIYNWRDDGEVLSDDFRHDLHQIVAYSAFNSMHTKQAVLAYPFKDFTVHKMTITSPLTRTEVTVRLVGIPIEKSKVEEVTRRLAHMVLFVRNSATSGLQ